MVMKLIERGFAKQSVATYSNLRALDGLLADAHKCYA